MVREIEELRGEVATLTTRVSMLAKELDTVNAITRQLALDLEEVLLKTIFAGKQNLTQRASSAPANPSPTFCERLEVLQR